jgi:primosomal protein N' (replication factor Y)
LGRAFAGYPVRRSGGDAVLAQVSGEPALVVATPGAEPVAAGGYAAALLLDGRLLLDRAVLRAGEEAARRWFSAAALVRGAPAGGSVVVLAESDHPVVQALVRWDPAGLAERELAARRQANLPPAARVAELVGEGADVADLLAQSTLPGSAQVLGPVPLDADPGPPAAAPAAQPAGPGRGRARSAASGASALDLPAEPSSAGRVRALVVAPLRDGAALAAALHAGAGLRSARRSGGPVTVRIDPVDLG